MSPDFDYNEREQIEIKVGDKELLLEMYPEEVSLSKKIELHLNMVQEGNGIAFFLPALPSDDGYNSSFDKGQWLYRSYIFTIVKIGDIFETQQMPCPIFMDNFDTLKTFLDDMDENLKERLKVIPATLFARVMGFFPEEIDLNKSNVYDHVLQKTPLKDEIIDKISALGLGSYSFLYRVGMRVHNFLELLTNYDDLSVDHFMFRMLKEHKYEELTPFSIYRSSRQIEMPGF